MSARAPEAIQHLWRDIDAAIPRAQLGGIVGDVAHSFGYHLARRDLPGGDYSVQLTGDRLGANDCASALDVTLPSDLMKTCTKRLVDAIKAHDPRVRAIREVCGTLDGSITYPWQQFPDNESEGPGSWDDSHLWHIHISFLREFADNYAALAPVADVIAGTPLTKEFTVQKSDEDKIRAIVRDETEKTFESVLGRFFSRNGDGKETHRLTAWLDAGLGHVSGYRRLSK